MTARTRRAPEQRARFVELLGASVLGGGIVALGYEMTDRGVAEAPAAAAETVATIEGNAGDAQEVPLEAAGDDGEALAGDSGESAPPTPSEEPGGGRPPWRIVGPAGSYLAFPPIYDADPPPFDAAAEAEFPSHGLVTGLGVIVRERTDLEAPIIGVLHAGTRVRTDMQRLFGGGCKEGWNKIFPRGFVCRAAGMTVEDTPPDDGVVAGISAPDIEKPLPYEYWRVKDEMTPFFHRLPSFGEQDQADAAGSAWYAEHAREPMPTHPAERPEEVPAVVKEYMNAGYYVTKAGEEVKSQRRFLRTQRGAYARKYQLTQKESPEFRGRLLDGVESLPLYFIRRSMPLLRREGEGSDVLIETETSPERLSTHPFVRELHIGARDYYEDADGHLLRAYAVGKAYKLKRPPGVGSDERWIHIDLSEQTLVAYLGDEPVFATLVSTGKEPGMTPVGVHRVQIKHVATSMRDQPIEDEAYSIEDVPWTQYFHGSVALHGAFWHAGFGQVRSHGCVNLSPPDARWLFGFTDPPLPDGWHAAAPTRGTPKGSAIVVTE